MELGQTLGYEGEDLRKYVAQCIEAERAQKEADRALEREKATIAAENEAKKAKIEAETEKAKIEAEKMTAENKRLQIEAEKAKVEAEKKIEMAIISAQRESENQLQVRRLESEVKIRTSSSAGSLEHGGINGGMKSLKLLTFNEDMDDLFESIRTCMSGVRG